MIGYYVHHVGRGHLDRALEIARRLPMPVTGLSTLPRPDTWPGRWLQLAPDDAGTVVDPTAGGTLHWAPRHHDGLCKRTAAITSWIEQARPRVMVVDLSVEVAMLCRLTGTPVITTVLPGCRDDPGHQLCYELSDLLIAPWPDLDGLCDGLQAHRAKVVHVGGLSRFEGRALEPPAMRVNGRLLVALSGAAAPGHDLDEAALPAGWRVCRMDIANWVADPWPLLCSADVVASHAGLGALADVAAARKPLICIPQDRPHHEQRHTAAVLARTKLGVVRDDSSVINADTLKQALRMDTSRWLEWSPGGAAMRAVDAIMSVAS